MIASTRPETPTSVAIPTKYWATATTRSTARPRRDTLNMWWLPPSFRLALKSSGSVRSTVTLSGSARSARARRAFNLKIAFGLGLSPAAFDEVCEYANEENENEQREKPGPPAVSCDQHVRLRRWGLAHHGAASVSSIYLMAEKGSWSFSGDYSLAGGEECGFALDGAGGVEAWRPRLGVAADSVARDAEVDELGRDYEQHERENQRAKAHDEHDSLTAGARQELPF
jgi:hypothetical protein